MRCKFKSNQNLLEIPNFMLLALAVKNSSTKSVVIEIRQSKASNKIIIVIAYVEHIA